MAYPQRCVTAGCGGLAEARSNYCIDCELSGRGVDQPGRPLAKRRPMPVVADKPAPRPDLRRSPRLEQLQAYTLHPTVMRPALALAVPDQHARRVSSRRMRAIRCGLAMTQMEFAHELGVSIACVSNWETGKYRPSGLAEQAIRNLCVAYDFDPNTMQPFA